MTDYVGQAARCEYLDHACGEGQAVSDPLTAWDSASSRSTE